MASTDKYLNFPKGRGATWTDDGQRLRRPDGTEVDISGAVTTLAAAQDALPGTTAFTVLGRLTAGDGYGGTFEWVAGNQSANVTLDPKRAVWIPPNSAPTGSAGAWRRVRQNATVVHADWFGSTFDHVQIQAAVDYVRSTAPNGGVVRLVAPTWMIGARITVRSPVQIIGEGMDLVTLFATTSMVNGSPFFENLGFPTDGSAGSPGLVWEGFTLDGSLKGPAPAWLSKLDGTPITDPEADYLPGGCLSPTIPATCQGNIVNGEIVSYTVLTPGSGYVAPPTVWISGDGKFARARATISAGSVTLVERVDGGTGWTTCNVQIVGGGDYPTALYTADRRNPNYATAVLVGFRINKAINPVIRKVRFRDISGMQIIDRGSDYLIVEFCEFINCGNTSSISNALWSASYGSPTLAAYRLSTNTVFRFNKIRGAKRSAAMLSGQNQRAHGNDIDGWGESCFFLTDGTKNAMIYENSFRNGVLDDIACYVIEGSGASTWSAWGNTIFDSEATPFRVSGDAVVIDGNRVEVKEARWRETFPFGPEAERIAYAQGTFSIAGTARWAGFLGVAYLLDETDGDNQAPHDMRVINNTLTDPNGVFPYFFTTGYGEVQSAGDVLISGNSLVGAPSTQMFDPEPTDILLGANTRFRCFANPGHTSMTGWSISQTNAAGVTGTLTFAGGYTPALATVTLRGTGANARYSTTYTIPGGVSAGAVTMALQDGAGNTLISLSNAARWSGGVKLTVSSCTASVEVTVSGS